MKNMHLGILSKRWDTTFWPDGGDNHVRIVCVHKRGQEENPEN